MQTYYEDEIRLDPRPSVTLVSAPTTFSDSETSRIGAVGSRAGHARAPSHAPLVLLSVTTIPDPGGLECSVGSRDK
jgi:hypothetical protein